MNQYGEYMDRQIAKDDEAFGPVLEGVGQVDVLLDKAEEQLLKRDLARRRRWPRSPTTWLVSA